jgi:hypothetical protein
MTDDSATASWRERLSQTFLKPSPARPASPTAEDNGPALTDAERRARINQIDATERRVGYAGAVLAAVVAVVVAVVNSPGRLVNATRVHKGWSCTAGYRLVDSARHTPQCQELHSTWIIALVVPLVLALAILVTVRIGRRAPLAFTILITGVASPGLEIAVPFLAAGGWLILRAWRTQRYGSPTAKSPVPGYEPPSRRAASGPRAAGTSAGRGDAARRRGKGAMSSSTERKPPAPSKRYTPKAPKRKRPPPAD